MRKTYAPLLCWLLSGFAAIAQPTVGFSSFITGLTAPVDIVNAHDGSNRLFIVQQNGIVRIRKTIGMVTRPFLNMSSLITYSGEQGLLSVAFHPKYAANRYLFVYYNNAAGNVELAQYRTSATDPDSVDVTSRKVMLTITKPFTNHNGCKLNFGPDSLLYFGTGDGGSGGDPNNYAQNLNSYLGKMLRIRADSFTTAPYYTVPSTNPLVGVANTKPEIYDWGLRNPWRWSFDRQTGDMWIADVGQGAWEEVNMVPAAGTNGLNFGWRCYEGNHSYDLSSCGATPLSGKTFPIFEYGHNSAGGYSITGGLVYRGTQYPALQGYYLCADYVTTNGWLIKPNGTSGWTTTKQTNFPANVSTFGDAEDGTLYLASLSGTIYQVTATAALPARGLSFSASMVRGQDVLKWSCTPNPALSGFEVMQSRDGERYEVIARMLPGPDGYYFTTPALFAERFYRIKAQYSNGSDEYSATVRLRATEAIPPFANTAPGQIWLTSPVMMEEVTLLNMQGRRIRHFEGVQPGRQALSTAGVVPGMYLLQCRATDRPVENMRVFVQ